MNKGNAAHTQRLARLVLTARMAPRAVLVLNRFFNLNQLKDYL